MDVSYPAPPPTDLPPPLRVRKTLRSLTIIPPPKTTTTTDCRQLAPVWEQLAKELEGEVYVAKINGPKCRSLQQRLHVKAYPSILYLRDGETRLYDGGARTLDHLSTYARTGWKGTKPFPFYMAPNNVFGRSVGWVYRIPSAAHEVYKDLKKGGFSDVSIIFTALAVPVAAGMFAIFMADVWVVRTTRAQGLAARRRVEARALLREQREALERMNRQHVD